jgi:hypothetical protein
MKQENENASKMQQLNKKNMQQLNEEMQKFSSKLLIEQQNGFLSLLIISKLGHFKIALIFHLSSNNKHHSIK